MINNLVDKIFLITTLNSDRYEYISTHLKQNDIDYDLFIAVNYELLSKDIKIIDSGDDTRPSLSLISAFTSIIYSSKLNRYKSIAILEDDCYFSENWKLKFKNFYESITNEWDILNLGYHPSHDIDSIKEKVNDYVYKPLSCHYTTHCILLKNKCFDEFLNITEKYKNTLPSDYIFNEIYKNKNFNSFSPSDRIVYQLSIRNKNYDIENTNLRFKSFVDC